MYRYFVSFHVKGRDRVGTFSGFAQGEFHMDNPITGAEDIRKVTEFFEEQNGYPTGSVVVINFVKFEES
ncbi:hypothetical protein [Exiguobacterium sp. s192]|uniref:hypothetical protein n=1 Tax=Exiguobacterium sp. s192 TaxID=2751206 RepID=UPI001BEC6323|nr:hypothetical protein [Exiguobacterium sp. s192]